MHKKTLPLVVGIGVLALAAVPLLAVEAARMTGGGSVLGTNAQGNTIRVTHGFELHCDLSRGPNRLEINWDGGNHFSLTSLDSLLCFSEAGPDPGGKTGLPNLYNGCGFGLYNGQPGFRICFNLTDHGEPGDNDTAEYFISEQQIVLNVPQTKLTFGNHQALPDK